MTRKKKARPAITVDVTIVEDAEPSPAWIELWRLLLDEAQQAATVHNNPDSLAGEPPDEEPAQ